MAIEALSWTLTLSAPAQHVAEEMPAPGEAVAPNAVAEQSLFDPTSAERVDVPVYLRDDLRPGTCIEGPALITEDQTTTVVTAAFDASTDARGNIILMRREANHDG